MLTPHQKDIMNFLLEGEKPKKDIVYKFRHWHYANNSKHVGDILSRMVNRGLILRVKKGVYSLNTHFKAQTNNKPIGIDNQLSMF